MSDEDAASLAHALMAADGVDAQFEPLVENVLRGVRATLGVPADAVDPVLEEELAAARRRLADFRADYRDVYARLIVAHVGAERLADVVAAVRQETIQLYLRAQRELRADWSRDVAALSKRMADAVLFEPPP